MITRMIASLPSIWHRQKRWWWCTITITPTTSAVATGAAIGSVACRPYAVQQFAEHKDVCRVGFRKYLWVAVWKGWAVSVGELVPQPNAHQDALATVCNAVLLCVHEEGFGVVAACDVIISIISTLVSMNEVACYRHRGEALMREGGAPPTLKSSWFSYTEVG